MAQAARVEALAEPGKNFCEVCAEQIGPAAKLCSKCNFAQRRWYSHPDLLLTARVANVLLIPIVIAIATYWYQGFAQRKEIARATIQQVTSDVQATADLAGDLLAAEKRLTTNCSTEDAKSTSACLSYYVGRLVVIDALVGRISWKMSTLPVAGSAYKSAEVWKNNYWSKHRIAAKKVFRDLANSGELLTCQRDFEGECGDRVRYALKDFDSETLNLFCGLVVEIGLLRLHLYESLAAQGADELLKQKMSAHIEGSYCYRLEQKNGAAH